MTDPVEAFLAGPLSVVFWALHIYAYAFAVLVAVTPALIVVSLITGWIKPYVERGGRISDPGF
jgi:hypothetical protein